MVWLDMVDAGGNGLYLDVLRRERRRRDGVWVDEVIALLGDGTTYEGEVHIDLTAGATTVTFVDQWLRPHDLATFFARISRDEVEASLVACCWTLWQKRPGDKEQQLPRPAHQQGKSGRSTARTTRRNYFTL